MRVQLPTAIEKLKSSKTDEERMICLNTIEKILQRHLLQTEQLKDQTSRRIEQTNLRNKYRKHKLERGLQQGAQVSC